MFVGIGRSAARSLHSSSARCKYSLARPRSPTFSAHRPDVTRTVRSREYWHASLSGEVAVEEHEVLAEHVEAVTCRWCSASDHIEVVPRPEFGGPSQEAPGDGGV